jgi:adenine phosphoribosyltransferase
MTSPELGAYLRSSIRTIADYPKPGIMFRDITTLLGDARAFRRTVDELGSELINFSALTIRS